MDWLHLSPRLDFVLVMFKYICVVDLLIYRVASRSAAAAEARTDAIIQGDR